MTEERLAALMVKSADGFATSAEQHELETHLLAHPALAEELEAHMQIKAVTEQWVRRLDVDLISDQHQARPSVQLEARVGLALLGAGIGILGGFGLTELMLDAEAPLWLKIGLSAILSGTLVLFISVVRARLATSKHDAYNEVIR
ncbi:MAG: hypothetical protein ACI8S6_004212 [Myxococcota bacterium]|jgi:hypothetical protein